jgi:hypothetical protein
MERTQPSRFRILKTTHSTVHAMLNADLLSFMQQAFDLNIAVKRDVDRFSEDFMFQITKEEADYLRFQIGMSKTEI